MEKATEKYITELQKTEEYINYCESKQKAKEESVPEVSANEIPAARPSGIIGEIYESMPVGAPVSADFFERFALDSGKLMAYIAMLEVQGYVISTPGGTYLRKF
jgi:hypothetical protein